MRYFKKIIGERIYLSPMNKEDVEIYTKWLNDEEVAVNLGQYAKVITLNNEQKTLENMTTDGYNFAIVKNDDTLIGNISLMNIKHTSRSAVTGLFIGEKENRGNGYGTEAMRLILDYGFNTLNLHNIMLNVYSDNKQAIACYKKVGFIEFGRRREACYKNGRYVDDVHMDILDEEFNRSKQANPAKMVNFTI